MGSHLLPSVNRDDRLGYAKPPPVEEAAAAHGCPSTRGWKSSLSLPSMPCRATAYIDEKALMAASAIHTMAVLQVSRRRPYSGQGDQFLSQSLLGLMAAAVVVCRMKPLQLWLNMGARLSGHADHLAQHLLSGQEESRWQAGEPL